MVLIVTVFVTLPRKNILALTLVVRARDLDGHSLYQSKKIQIRSSIFGPWLGSHGNTEQYRESSVGKANREEKSRRSVHATEYAGTDGP